MSLLSSNYSNGSSLSWEIQSEFSFPHSGSCRDPSLPTKPYLPRRRPPPHQVSTLVVRPCLSPVFRPPLHCFSIGSLASTRPGTTSLSSLLLSWLSLVSESLSDYFPTSMRALGRQGLISGWSACFPLHSIYSLAQGRCSVHVQLNGTKPGSEWQAGKRRDWS